MASRIPRQHCACGRPALFLSPKKRRWVSRPDHPMCQRCWRADQQAEGQRLYAGRARHCSAPRGYVPLVHLDTPELRAFRAALVVLEAAFPAGSSA